VNRSRFVKIKVRFYLNHEFQQYLPKIKNFFK